MIANHPSRAAPPPPRRYWMIGKRCCANALLFFALCGALPIHRIASAQPSDSPLDATVRDLCRKQIAVLGEPPMHGFARTSELKVAIVERLVDQCGYTGIVFESGTYDFLNIERRRERGEPVEASMVRAAIGGLWGGCATRSVSRGQSANGSDRAGGDGRPAWPGNVRSARNAQGLGEASAARPRRRLS